MKPDAADLCDAVALFLSKELTPSIEDRRMAFRVRIAAYLVSMVGRELTRTSPSRTSRRWSRRFDRVTSTTGRR